MIRHGGAIAAGLVLALLSTIAAPGHARATVYEVGPGQPLTNIGDVPWESLAAGDEVRIHHRPTPYAEKFVICAAGTAAQPVVIRGIPGPAGELPIISGDGATTRAQTNFWNEERGVIKIGGANSPDCALPTYVTLQDLEVRSARAALSFTGRNGLTSYAANAAAVFVETAQHLTLRGLVLHGAGNGLFIAAANGDTQDVLVEGCSLFDNGNVASAFEHNSYTSARGIVFQYNHYGPLCAGCAGNNLKDRSAGLVVRYNFIESGNRQLDLVDGEDTANIPSDPRYRATFVYGNVLVEPDGAGNSQIVHYGGDSGNIAIYRKGTLYFHHNTVVSTRAGNTTLFRLSTGEESVDARNNVFYVTAGGSALGVSDGAGAISLAHDWANTGYVPTHGTLTGTVVDAGGNVTGTDPGFVSFASGDYHLAAGSPCLDAAGPLAAAVGSTYDAVMHYVPERSSESRPYDPPADVGAFERCASGSCSMPRPDAGVATMPDAGLATMPDAAVGGDGGVGSPRAAGSCGCRIVETGAEAPASWLALGLAACVVGWRAVRRGARKPIG